MDGLHHTPLKPLRIAVLAGGDSAEREISLQSGAAVANALTSRGHLIVMVDPAETSLEDYRWSDVDVAFLALHGTFGEDGGVQRILERLGVVFTGSDSEASKLAFSKSAAKERFGVSGVSTPGYALIHETDSQQRVTQQAAEIGYPLIVKPDRQGSSLGVVIVEEPASLTDAVSQCFTLDSFGLLERAISGSEWTLGVIDDQPLPLIRIGTDRGFFDFDAKYQDDATEYHFDESLSAELREQLTTIGLQACRAVGTCGVARADIMLDDGGQPWVLEVNTIPGMTDHSLVPKAAAHVGLDMGQLCEIIVERALAAGQRRLRQAS